MPGLHMYLLAGMMGYIAGYILQSVNARRKQKRRTPLTVTKIDIPEFLQEKWLTPVAPPPIPYRRKD